MPIAICRYTLTKELFYEATKRITQETYMRFAIKIVIAVAVTWVLVATATWLFAKVYWLLLIETLVSAMIILWVAVYTPWERRHRAFVQLTNRYGEHIVRTIEFYEEKLTVRAGGRMLNAVYADVQKVLETEHFCILLLENDNAVMVNKDGFTTGTLEDVLALLPTRAS